MTSAENFKHFLLENKAYTEYCYEINEQHNSTFNSVTEGGGDLRDIINTTLSWDHTENADLWMTLNPAWNKAVIEGKRFYNNCKSIW